MHYAALHATLFALRNSIEYFPCVVKMLCLYICLCNYATAACNKLPKLKTQIPNTNPKSIRMLCNQDEGIMQSAKRFFLACCGETSALGLQEIQILCTFRAYVRIYNTINMIIAGM